MPARNNGTTVALEAQDASITTATITIKALQVGKKQMTQSVFRQLPVAELVEEAEPKLLAEPWGWVNYCPRDEDDKATQFVFLRGSTLCRSAFRIRPSTEFRLKSYGPRTYLALREAWEACVRPLHCARILEGWHPGGDKASVSHEYWRQTYKSGSFGECYASDVPSNTHLMAPSAMEDRVADAIGRHKRTVSSNSIYDRHYNKTAAEVDAETRESVTTGIKNVRDWASKTIVEGFGSSASAEQIWRRMWQLESEAEDYCRRWDALMDRLRAVEQLYIAC